MAWKASSWWVRRSASTSLDTPALTDADRLTASLPLQGADACLSALNEICRLVGSGDDVHPVSSSPATKCPDWRVKAHWIAGARSASVSPYLDVPGHALVRMSAGSLSTA